MRCTECGYANDEGTKICTKCGTKLSAASSAAKKPPDNSFLGTKTVKGNISAQPAWDAPISHAAKMQDSSAQEDYYRCDDCGHYPLEAKVSISNPCTNCNSTGENKPKEKPTPSKVNKAPSFGKTVRLEELKIGAKKPKITLLEVNSGKVMEFEGDKINLNRENLDPSNETISSNHATLSYKNGSWEITDHSSNEATFIQVKGTMIIPVGAKIIFGNKIFNIGSAE